MSLSLVLPELGLPEVTEPDPALLQALVSDYERMLDGTPPDMKTFLFGRAPIAIFRRIFAEGPGELPGESLIWVLLLSGYFGGVWLRSELRSAQPDGMLSKLGNAPTREAVEGFVESGRSGQRAAHGADAETRAYTEAVLPELIASFGYNQGYLLEILESPPARIRPPDGFLVPGGPLWCGYGKPRLEVLASLHDISARLASFPTAAWRAIGEVVQERQPAEVERGRQVWSTGLSMQGFSQAAYDQLLDVSSSFLEIIQATALTAARACAADDLESARVAAFANGCVAPWLGAYALGLMDNRPDAEERPPLPRFR